MTGGKTKTPVRPPARTGAVRKTAVKPEQKLRIKRRSLHEEVIERLRDMIVEGAIKAGERLNETALADTLGVSRTPIREALKLLASEGMVELMPNRGARVIALASHEIAELFEVISGLERYAAELAAQRMTKDDFDRLQVTHDRMAMHYQNRNRRDYSKLNNEVHMRIVALSGNGTLAAIHHSLMVRVRRVRYAALEVEERWREAFEEHVALMQALRDKDSRRAGAIMLAHSRETGEVALSSYLAQAAASSGAEAVETAG